MRTSQHEVSSAGGALCIYAAREVSVCIEMQLNGVQPITYPADHTETSRLGNVADKVVQLLVVPAGPFCDEFRQVIDCL